jgi:hypothetical protein
VHSRLRRPIVQRFPIHRLTLGSCLPGPRLRTTFWPCCYYCGSWLVYSAESPQPSAFCMCRRSVCSGRPYRLGCGGMPSSLLPRFIATLQTSFDARQVARPALVVAAMTRAEWSPLHNSHVQYASGVLTCSLRVLLASPRRAGVIQGSVDGPLHASWSPGLNPANIRRFATMSGRPLSFDKQNG